MIEVYKIYFQFHGGGLCSPKILHSAQRQFEFRKWEGFQASLPALGPTHPPAKKVKRTELEADHSPSICVQLPEL